MANTFKNASGIINATPGTVLYTVPSGRTAVIHSLFVSNNSASPQTVTIELVDADASANFNIVTNAPVPVGGSISLPKPVNLESLDAIRIIASTGGTLEAVASVLEIS